MLLLRKTTDYLGVRPNILYLRHSLLALVAIALSLALPAADGQTKQDVLFQRALRGTICE